MLNYIRAVVFSRKNTNTLARPSWDKAGNLRPSARGTPAATITMGGIRSELSLLHYRWTGSMTGKPWKDPSDTSDSEDFGVLNGVSFRGLIIPRRSPSSDITRCVSSQDRTYITDSYVQVAFSSRDLHSERHR